MCWGHYARWHRYGHPLASPPRDTAQRRVMRRTTTSEVGCWVYDIGNPDRVPRAMNDAGRVVSVATILWEACHGPVPDGAQVRSTCGITLCVRPDHHQIKHLARSAA